MQLFGWTLHSCWMLLTVISVCCCGDIGSSTEINDEVMEEQPWIWNDFKLAGALRKFHSILGVTEEDNDNMAAMDDTVIQASAAAAIPKANTVTKAASNFRENQQQQQEQQQKQQQQQQQQQHRVRVMADSSGNGNEDDYIYDVEGRPLTDTGRLQFYVKPTDKKRSQHQAPNDGQLSVRRRQQQLQLQSQLQSQLQQQQQQQGSSISSSSSSSSSSSVGGDDAASSPSMSVLVRDAEPRVLPLLGFHTAVNKINRPKEALLKKILRQAARRQSMKRSPNCMRKCIAQGLLHPAQCHSLC